MKLKLVNGQRRAARCPKPPSATKFNEALVHQVVTAYRNAGRAGTKAQKTARRSARRRQEAARAEGHRPGARRLEPQPIWVGGGRTFAAKPRDFTQKVNRKMYRGAIRSMLSELARTERLLVDRRHRRSRRRRPKLLANQLKDLVARLGADRGRGAWTRSCSSPRATCRTSK